MDAWAARSAAVGAEGLRSGFATSASSTSSSSSSSFATTESGWVATSGDAVLSSFKIGGLTGLSGPRNGGSGRSLGKEFTAPAPENSG